jgi:hypothetical protein
LMLELFQYCGYHSIGTVLTSKYHSIETVLTSKYHSIGTVLRNVPIPWYFDVRTVSILW